MGTLSFGLNKATCSSHTSGSNAAVKSTSILVDIYLYLIKLQLSIFYFTTAFSAGIGPIQLIDWFMTEAATKAK